MEQPKFNTFQEFYPFYLSEHAAKQTKLVHVWVTLVANIFGVLLILNGAWGWLAANILLAYGINWWSHFKFMGNNPTTFQHPVWSFMSDYKMSYEYFSNLVSGGSK